MFQLDITTTMFTFNIALRCALQSLQSDLQISVVKFW